MDCRAHCVCAGPLGFCFQYATYIEGCMVQTSESYFDTKLVRGFDEGIHTSSVCFG